MSYPALRFYAEDGYVYALVEVDIPVVGRRLFRFKFSTGNSVYDALLAEELDKQFRDAFRDCKRAAYNKGWKDKTQRNLKQHYFCPDLDNEEESL